MRVLRGVPQPAFDNADLVDGVKAELYVGDDGVLTIRLPATAPRAWLEYFTLCGFDSGPPWCYHLRLEHSRP